MQQADDVSSYAREDRPRLHGVRSLMSYSNTVVFFSSHFVIELFSLNGDQCMTCCKQHIHESYPQKNHVYRQ